MDPVQAQALPYRYTEREQKRLLDSLSFLVDAREQDNGHITDYLDRKGVEYQERALSFGDYSFFLPADPELGVARDICFDKQLVIERKANLEELSRCFAQDRARFEAELIRSQGAGAKLVLLVENGSYRELVCGEYDTEYRAKSFVGTLFSFMHRYDLQVSFIPGRLAGNYIYHVCHYYLREWLK